MAQITNAIGSRAFELIRNQIGAVLADELPSQATLNGDPRLNAEVFVERFKPVGDEEISDAGLVIVGFSDGDFGLKTSLSVDGNMTFLIDCYEKAKATINGGPDKAATIRLQRLIGVIHGILSHFKYRTLGLAPPFIEHTEVKEIKMAAPKNAMDASSVVMARLEFIVRAPDNNIATTPTIIDGYTTQALLDLTDLGYTYGNYTMPPVPPVCPDVQIELNGISVVSAESGATIDIPVVDSNNNVVGSWDGVKFTISDGINTLNGVTISGILPEGTKTITLVDGLGATFVPTVLNDSKTNLELEISLAPDSLDVYYWRPDIINVPQVFTYDEGWMFDNNFDPPFLLPNGAVYQKLDLTVFSGNYKSEYLFYKNAFGHKFRFTGLNGGYYNFMDGLYYDKYGVLSNRVDVFAAPVGSASLVDGYIIDHLAGVGHRAVRGGAQAFGDALNYIATTTVLTFSDWKTLPINYYIMLIDFANTNWLYDSSRKPFAMNQTYNWSCTVSTANPSQAWRMAAPLPPNNASVISAAANRTFSRIHYLRTEFVTQ